MKDVNQMTPMEIVESLFNEIDKLNKRLDKIEKNLEDGNISLAKKLLTIDEAAEYLSLAKRTLYKLTHKNSIPYYKSNGRIYFKREELDDHMTKNYCPTNDDLNQMASDYILKSRLKRK